MISRILPILLLLPFLMAGGPITDMGHFKLIKKSPGTYSFDLTVPRWLAQQLMSDSLPASQVGDLSSKLGQQLHGKLLTAEASCRVIPDCRWEAVSAFASPDQVRVLASCLMDQSQTQACLHFPFLGDVPSTFFLDSKLKLSKFWKSRKITVDHPRLVFGRDGQAVLFDINGEPVEKKQKNPPPAKEDPFDFVWIFMLIIAVVIPMIALRAGINKWLSSKENE